MCGYTLDRSRTGRGYKRSLRSLAHLFQMSVGLGPKTKPETEKLIFLTGFCFIITNKKR